MSYSIMVKTPSTTRYVTRVSSELSQTNLPVLEGEPIIMGTKVPIRDIVALWQDNVRPEDIPAMLYNQVSAAQVFDALGFYLDNKIEIDDYLQRYRELGILSRSAIILSHSPFWDEVEAEIKHERLIPVL